MLGLNFTANLSIKKAHLFTSCRSENNVTCFILESRRWKKKKPIYYSSVFLSMEPIRGQTFSSFKKPKKTPLKIQEYYGKST